MLPHLLPLITTISIFTSLFEATNIATASLQVLEPESTFASNELNCLTRDSYPRPCLPPYHLLVKYIFILQN